MIGKAIVVISLSSCIGITVIEKDNGYRVRMFDGNRHWITSSYYSEGYDW